MKMKANTEKTGKGAVPADNPAVPVPNSMADLALMERRKIVRPLPVPQADESERDSTWALYQELSRDVRRSTPESKLGQ